MAAIDGNTGCRRGVADVAVKACCELLALSSKSRMELLRRLSIIAVEDVAVVDAIAPVMWFTIACAGNAAKGFEGYELRHGDVAWLLQQVHAMASHGCSQMSPSSLSSSSVSPASPSSSSSSLPGGACGAAQVNPTSTKPATTDRVTLAKALALRASYGGMACDIAMMQQAADSVSSGAREWHKLDDRDAASPPMAVEWSNLQVHEWLPVAIDFHVDVGIW